MKNKRDYRDCMVLKSFKKRTKLIRPLKNTIKNIAYIEKKAILWYNIYIIGLLCDYVQVNLHTDS